MPNKHNILHLDINGITVEKIPILNGKDVTEIKNGLISAYSLNIRTVWYEIYFFKPSSMNIQQLSHENSKQDHINRN